MYLRLFVVLILIGAGALQVGAQSPVPSPSPSPSPSPAPAQSNDYVFPLFVDGTTGGVIYRSVLRVTNTSGVTPLACTLNQRNTNSNFVGVQNYFYPANVVDAGFSPLSVTPVPLYDFLPFEILRTNGQSPLKTGYVKLSCPGTVQAQLQFSLTDAKGNKLGEAAIPSATQGASFQFLVDRRDGTRLGFSLTDDSATGGQYGVIARDQFNNVVAQSYEHTIQPFSQVSQFIDEVLPLPSDFVGSIEIVGVSGGSNYVIGLQFTGPVFSTIVPIVRSKPIGS
jgi:hypothetical protein